jgi:hypothetical protein
LVLALNHHPPDLFLLSSWDYRREPPAARLTNFFLTLKMICDVATLPFCRLQAGYFVERLLWSSVYFLMPLVPGMEPGLRARWAVPFP